jgi:hypothetical protein
VKDQVNEVRFEAAMYSLLKGNLNIRASSLLYFRVPVQHPGTKTAPPVDLSGNQRVARSDCSSEGHFTSFETPIVSC